jgi:hypothetical protein
MPFSRSAEADALTTGRGAPTICATKSCVSSKRLVSARSDVSSSQRASRCSDVWKRLHNADWASWCITRCE